MILELAILNVKPGQNESFESDIKKARSIISGISGFLSISLRQCVENSNRYILLVEWNKLEDHTINFRESKEYLEWKSILHNYYDPFPVVEHYDRVII